MDFHSFGLLKKKVSYRMQRFAAASGDIPRIGLAFGLTGLWFLGGAFFCNELVF